MSKHRRNLALSRAKLVTYPPPNLPQTTNEEIEKQLPFVADAERQKIKNGVSNWPVTQSRLILQWMLSWFGLTLSFADTKAGGINRLAAVQQFRMQRPIPFPTAEDYHHHAQLAQEAREKEWQNSLRIPKERLLDMRRQAEQMTVEAFKKDGLRLKRTLKDLPPLDSSQLQSAPSSPSQSPATFHDEAQSALRKRDAGEMAIASANKRAILQLRSKLSNPDSPESPAKRAVSPASPSRAVDLDLLSQLKSPMGVGKDSPRLAGTKARLRLAVKARDTNIINDAITNAVQRLDTTVEGEATLAYNNCENPVVLLHAARNLLLVSKGKSTSAATAPTSGKTSPVPPGAAQATAIGTIASSEPASGTYPTYKTMDGRILTFRRTREEEMAKYGICRGGVYRYTDTDLVGVHIVVLGMDEQGAMWRYEERFERSIVIDERARPFLARTAADLQKIHPLELVASNHPCRASDPFWFPCYEGPIQRFNITESACGKFKVTHGQRYLCRNPPPYVKPLPGDVHGPVIIAIGTDGDGNMCFASDCSGAWTFKATNPIADLGLVPLYLGTVTSFSAADADEQQTASLVDNGDEQTQTNWFRCPAEVQVGTGKSSVGMVVFDIHPDLLARFLDYAKTTQEQQKRSASSATSTASPASQNRAAIVSRLNAANFTFGSSDSSKPAKRGGGDGAVRFLGADSPAGNDIQLDGAKSMDSASSGVDVQLPSMLTKQQHLPLLHGCQATYRTKPSIFQAGRGAGGAGTLSRIAASRQSVVNLQAMQAQQPERQGQLHKVIIIGCRNGQLYKITTTEEIARPLTLDELETLAVRRGPPQRRRMVDLTRHEDEEKEETKPKPKKAPTLGVQAVLSAEEELALASKRLDYLSSPDVMESLVQQMGRSALLLPTRTAAQPTHGGMHLQSTQHNKIKALNGFSRLCLFDTTPTATAAFGFYTGDLVQYVAGHGIIRKCVIYGVRNDTLWKVDLEDEDDIDDNSSDGGELSSGRSSRSPSTAPLGQRSSSTVSRMRRAARKASVFARGSSPPSRRGSGNKRKESTASSGTTVTLAGGGGESAEETIAVATMFNHCSTSHDIEQRYGAVLLVRGGGTVKSFKG